SMLLLPPPRPPPPSPVPYTTLFRSPPSARRDRPRPPSQNGDTMSEKNVRLGIIGLGAQGGTYAGLVDKGRVPGMSLGAIADTDRSEEHTSELQSRFDLVCRLLLEKK